jgi:hypothetical protein
VCCLVLLDEVVNQLWVLLQPLKIERQVVLPFFILLIHLIPCATTNLQHAELRNSKLEKRAFGTGTPRLMQERQQGLAQRCFTTTW